MLTRNQTFSVIAILLFNFAGAYAQQTTGIIRGTVADETGGVLPGVDITARNQDTGITRVAVSDDEGRYRLSQLALGTYQVTGELAGFQAGIIQGVALSIVRESVVDITLRVGAITEQVIVTAEGSLVDTSSASVGTLVDSQSIMDLPLNGRDFIQLAALQEGVVTPTTGLGGRTGDTGLKMTISGTRPNQNAILLDGTDIKNYYGNTPGGLSRALLGVETVREFQVITNAYGAEYGRFTGGVISAVTKSGTNEIHGSLFEYHRNSALDARNFFDRDVKNPSVRSKPPGFIKNQFGFSIGGPIVQDQTFFFGAYEGLRERLTTTITNTWPNEDAHNGLIPRARSRGRLQPCPPDNFGNDEAAMVNGLCNVGVHPTIRPYMDLYPIARGGDFGDGTAEFAFPAPGPLDEDYFLVKVDHQISDSDSFFARYTFDWSDRLRWRTQYLYAGDSIARNQYTTLEEKHIFSPTLLNEFRFAFNRTRVHDIEVPNFDIDPSLFLLPDREGLIGLLRAGDRAISQFGNSTREPQRHTQNLFQTMDNLVLTRGSHALKMGVSWSRFQYNAANQAGFPGSYTWLTLGDFLINKPDSALHFFSDPYMAGIRQHLIGIYLQDDFQFSPNLTFNLGVRYEFITNPTEVNDVVGRIDRSGQTEPTIGGPLFNKNPSLKNFSPRVGFAWDPTGSGRYSVRGGYGLFHDQLLPWIYTLVPGRGKPFAVQSNYDVDQGDIIIFPDTLRNSQITDRAVQAPNVAEIFEVEQPYIMQWNLSLQAEVLSGTAVTATYSGSRGVHLTRIVDANVPEGVIEADGRRFIASGSPRPNPAFGQIQARQFDGYSSYHGVKLGLKRRFSSGISYQFSYTFQKFLDNGSNYTGSPGDFNTSNTRGTHWLDADVDKGPSAWNTPQTFSANATFDMPFGPGRRFGAGAEGAWGKVIEGWQINSLLRLADGPAVEINQGGNRMCNFCDERPDLIPGKTNRPNTGSPNRWFGDPEDNFTPSERGYFGTLGRNTGIGPGLATVDISILKSVSVGEEARVQFRAEFFNVFNRTNFHPPERARESFGRGSGTFPNASFGGIFETATTSRQIQFALRIDF